jgi:hypothetical protein
MRLSYRYRDSTHGDTIWSDFKQKGVEWRSSPSERRPDSSASRTRP